MEESWCIPLQDLSFGEKIGEGSFGVVYKAKYLGLDVAVKKVRMRAPSLNLTREISLLRNLRHPKIVLSIGVCIQDDMLFVVQEYIDGGDLCSVLKDPKTELSWPERTKLALQISQAMLYLHKNNVLHRDLKPENVLIEKSKPPAFRRCKIADFGLSTLIDDCASFEDQVGTFWWRAPETATSSYGPPADVFSFGVLLFEIITRMPGEDIRVAITYETKNKLEFKSNPVLILEDPQLGPLVRQSPTGLSQLAMLCCLQDPSHRPTTQAVVSSLQTISNLFTQLEAWAHTEFHTRAPVHQSRFLSTLHRHWVTMSERHVHELTRPETIQVSYDQVLGLLDRRHQTWAGRPMQNIARELVTTLLDACSGHGAERGGPMIVPLHGTSTSSPMFSSNAILPWPISPHVSQDQITGHQPSSLFRHDRPVPIVSSDVVAKHAPTHDVIVPSNSTRHVDATVSQFADHRLCCSTDSAALYEQDVMSRASATTASGPVNYGITPSPSAPEGFGLARKAAMGGGATPSGGGGGGGGGGGNGTSPVLLKPQKTLGPSAWRQFWQLYFVIQSVLEHPCIQPLYIAGFILGLVTSARASTMLLAASHPATFLIRLSTSNPGSLVITYLRRRQLHHVLVGFHYLEPVSEHARLFFLGNRRFQTLKDLLASCPTLYGLKHVWPDRPVDDPEFLRAHADVRAAFDASQKAEGWVSGTNYDVQVPTSPKNRKSDTLAPLEGLRFWQEKEVAERKHHD